MNIIKILTDIIDYKLFKKNVHFTILRYNFVLMFLH